MKVKTWIPLVLAVVLGLAALKLTRDAMSRKDAGAANNGDTVPVVTAVRAIEPGERITAEALTTTPMPVAQLPAGSFQKPSDVVDRVAVSAVAAAAPVLDAALAPLGTAGGMQALIPPGMRAITLRVDEFSGVGGMLVPGSKVDVIAVIGNDSTRGSMARTIVQNVEVRAVGRRVSFAQAAPEVEGVPAGLPPTNNVTLLVSPQQAETLQLASISGTPWLVLRNAKDGAALDSEGTTVADLRGTRGSETIDAPPPPVQQVSAQPGDKAAAPAPRAVARGPKSRTVRIIRATKEESVEVELPRVPEAAAPVEVPADQEWLSNTDESPAAGE